MTNRKPRSIDFDHVLRRIVNDPLDIQRRLEFAEWLGDNGQRDRADWIRRCCGICENVHPLLMSFTRRETEPSALSLRELQRLDEQWRSLRPAGWIDLPGVIQTLHFGRVIVRPLLNDDSELMGMIESDWLLEAFQECWVEMICVTPLNGDVLLTLSDWPAPHLGLPIYLDTTRAYSEKFDNGLMRSLLMIPGLRGLVLSPSEMAYSCVKKFSEFAAGLRYLQLTGLKATKTSVKMLEQLSNLSRLKSLVVGQGHPDDTTIELMCAASQLQYLGLFPKHITDRGLLRVAEMQSLRVLELDTPLVSRRGVCTLREARPDLAIVIRGDMRRRIGPA